MVRPVVHSTKHYIQFGISDITTGSQGVFSVATAVSTVDKNTSSEVEEGALIKAVYFEIWLLSSTNDTQFIMTISKNPEVGTGPTFTEHAALMTYTNKKNIFYTTQGIAQNDGVTGAIPIIRNWVKIPKSKQRFGLGDRLTMNISNVGAGNLQRCGFMTYKEYT